MEGIRDRGYVLRRDLWEAELHGESRAMYLEAVGYGGPGNPLPYWTVDLWRAKLWQLGSLRHAAEARNRFGGTIQIAEKRKWSNDWFIAIENVDRAKPDIE